ncbi:MAG TPA: hypothetical protein GX707_20830 [Epulopiscium sp.]|nr:hypothetical protein [Candidatus Epulonipiscium sp.]
MNIYRKNSALDVANEPLNITSGSFKSAQVILFRMENPVSGECVISVKGITIINGVYNIFIRIYFSKG